jgi:hypothetical protein
MDDEIDYILETFNFERVHVTMIALDWKWSKQNIQPSAVPTIERLKLTAKHLLSVAYKDETSIASGGFLAKYHPPIKDSDLLLDQRPSLSLSFIIVSANSKDYNDD